MRDLARSLHLSGRPVPVPWRQLGRYIKPRGQNLMVVLAAAGVGKSAFALQWATMLNHPSLYVSLDTALVDHAIRILARETGLTVGDITDGHDEDVEGWVQKWYEVLDDLPTKARFTDLTHTVRHVGELVRAETEYWGEPPALTIVDNLGDLLEEGESAAEYRRILLELKRVAVENDTLVVALHHLRKRPSKARSQDDDDEGDEGTQPVHVGDALYESDKHAKFVLGLWRPQPDRMAVGVLKNRMGPAARNGSLHVTLEANLERMRIEELGRNDQPAMV